MVLSESASQKMMTPGSALCLTDRQAEVARRWQAYVDVAMRECAATGSLSRRLMQRAVHRLAAERGEKPPAMSTIYRKLKALRKFRNFNPTLAMAPKNSMGNREKRFCDRAEEAMRIAVEDAWRDPKGSWKTVRARLYRMTSAGGEYSDLANLVCEVNGAARLVSARTIQRRFREVDEFTRDMLRYGLEYAERVHSRRIRQNRPSRPLDVVDVDHTTLGIVVFDEVRSIGFGRPDLVVFRDRYSGIILGWAISFGPPSLETFIDGLLHALLPKSEADLPPSVKYPWHGRMVCLGVDNASHLIGFPVREAAMELGFEIVPYRPAHPWEKGALEHLFHILNIQLVDRLPGATTLSPAERRKFDEERMKAVPQISMSELRGFLSYFFAEIHHVTPHEGLGELHTLSGVPRDLWDEGIAGAENRPLVDRDMMIAVCGDTTEVTIQNDGVRWDYLVYQSAELARLTLHHDHKTGTRQHSATKYKAVRDPSNLERIWVHNPYDGSVIEVPISSAMASYASGLKLYQHRKIVEYNNDKRRSSENAADLLKSMNELENELAAIHTARKKHGTAIKLARFISGQRHRIQRTRAVDVATSGMGRIDYATPNEAVPQPSRHLELPRAAVAVANAETDEPALAHTDDEDIDAIRAKHQEWE